MKIRPATPADLSALMQIFARARGFMAQTGNPNQWPPSYPGEELMLAEIARGVCYIAAGEDGTPEATFCYIPGPEPTYAKIYDGAWPNDRPYATIHRMASAGRVRGAAAFCIAWCASHGLPLRADTHHDNRVMQHLLEKNGFARCGRILLANGSPRIAYFRPAVPRGAAERSAEQMAECLADAVSGLPHRAGVPLLVALDGRCAAGKTTAARYFAQNYGWGVVHLDDFFLQPNQRTPERLAGPGGNLDRERLIGEVLHPLTAGRSGQYRVFDCHTMRFAAQPRALPAEPVVLIEGAYACHPELRPYCALHAFADIEPGEQMRRLTARAPQRLADFANRWIPMEETYIAHFSVPEHCELCL